MAKELPYFQFEPGQYFAGNIQFCTYEEQGVFINICALYWQRSCELSREQLNKKFTEKLTDSLISSKVIKSNSKGEIIIDFLDEQFDLIKASKLRCSVNGKKGVAAKKQATLKPPLSQAEATLKHLDKIREDKIREDNIIDVWFSDLEKSDTINQISMNNEITIELCKTKLIEFKKYAEVEYPEYGRFVSHFKNWLIKNKGQNTDSLKPKMSW